MGIENKTKSHHNYLGGIMIKTDKLIICVAPCGGVLTKKANLNIPIQPEEIAEEVYRSWNEGASLAHIHARSKIGKATTDPSVVREISYLIREKGCDIILEFSPFTGLESTANVEDGFKVLEANPEIVSVGTRVNVHVQPEREQVTLWTRSFNERLTRAVVEMGIKPEFYVFDVGGLVEVNYLIEKIPLSKPYWIDFAMDMQKTIQNVTPFTPKNLIHLAEQLPPDSMFMTLGVAAAQTAAVVQSILLGGHARVGFEDNYFYNKGVLAKSNAELVARIARIGTDLGRSVATPNEARELLGISKLQSNQKSRE
jgi:3-keto-5-aminohexanoate cleavage enzyme